MTEHLPYSDEPWDDLPLPNRDEAWQKMQILLDKEEKQRRVTPFWFWRYAVIVLLLIGTAVGSYLLLHKKEPQQTATAGAKNTMERPEKNSSDGEKQQEKKTTVYPAETALVNVRQRRKTKTIENPQNDGIQLTENLAGVVKTSFAQTPKKEEQEKIIVRSQAVKSRTDDHKPLSSTRAFRNSTATHLQKESKAGATTGIIQPSPLLTVPTLQGRSVGTVQPVPKEKPDRARAFDSALFVSAQPPASNKKQRKKSRFYFSAGVGLQQALHFGSQQDTLYTQNNRQNRLAGLIPSAYLKVQSGKWFLQGELHYRVPQPLKAFSFSQTSSYNAANKTLQTERLSIQKLYYHQLPFSLNYFVMPNWSFGAGGTYNLFAGAATEQERRSQNVTTGAEMASRQVVSLKRYTDSFFYRSAAGVLLQTDYHWKRFSLGLRYTRNLQPFIKFTTPDGAVMSKKSEVLQAMLRFRLFSSEP